MKNIIISSHNRFMIENYRLNLIYALSTLGKIHTYIPRDNEPVGDFTKLSFKNMLLMIFASLVASGKKKQNVFDVVLTFGHRMNMLFGLMTYFSRFKFYPNITGQGRFYSSKRTFRQFIYVKLLKIYLKNAQVIFVQNVRDLGFIKSILSHKTVCLLPGSGVELKKYSFSNKREYNKLNLLYCARLISSKGLPDLLKTIDFDSYAYGRTLSLKIYGEYQRKDVDRISEKIVEKIQKTRKIDYVGFEEDKEKIYKSGDILIYLSNYNEGLPHALLEAMASGVICITYNRFYADQLIENGITGFKIDSKQELPDLLRRITELPNSKLAEIARAARKIVENQYNQDLVIGKYIEVIK